MIIEIGLCFGEQTITPQADGPDIRYPNGALLSANRIV
jgi:hypothetical protein